MADLIDRRAAIRLLRGECVGKYPSTFVMGLFAAADEINKLPTVDAVEVVRCKDCKHWLKDFVGCTEHIGRCEWAGYAVGANGYCVYGEKKADEQEERS